jgi:GNAT superfamily N-acetyltransferase
MSHPTLDLDGGPTHVALIGGRVAVIRAARLTDAAGVRALHLACSPATLRDRYAGAPPRLTASDVTALLHPTNGCTLVACAGRADGEVLGVAQVIGGPPVAELAILVRDDAQGRGLGTILGGKAVDAALARGCSELIAYGSAANPRPMRLLRRLGLRAHARYDGATVTLRASLLPDSAPLVKADLSVVPPLV